MTRPDKRFITIGDNKQKIEKLLHELVLEPRSHAIEWSKITRQTPNIKIGYPGQHLASLITGIEGERTGARGNDLLDGSEVKSCSRIDQLDKCKDCGDPVARLETVCPSCGSGNIECNNDSKWLFTIRNEADLTTLLHGTKRVFLLLGDYPNFEGNDFQTLRIQSFEIWPEYPRHANFAKIMTNYYKHIYLAHRKKDPSKTPAPKNFWPYTYQFYLCNPVLTFSCVIKNANTKPRLDIQHYVPPDVDRSNLPSLVMPVTILQANELELILKRASKKELSSLLKPATGGRKPLPNFSRMSHNERLAYFDGIPEELRMYLPLRDTDRIAVSRQRYSRRSH